jgi:uncharacterized protein YaiE (UPF0345 family)
MSRYDNSNNGSSDDNYDDDMTIKLQEYAAIQMTPSGVTANRHQQYGTSFIVNYDEMEILDGIVFQRDDDPQTWKVFSAGKFFNLNPEDGLVYEQVTEEGEYKNEMSAQDILDHPRVAGFSENFGGTDYFYTPVGVVIEEADQIATNGDLDVETSDDSSIVAGSSSMLLSNKTWVRTFAKKMTEEGNSIINDNGEYGEDAENPKNDTHEWLTTESPTLRSELEDRPLELWVTEESMEAESGDNVTYTVPNLMDEKTGNYVNIDNGIANDDSDEEAQAAATDGGTVTDSGSDTTDSASTESTDSPSASSDDDGLPEGVPDKLEGLLGYLARNNDDIDAAQVRDFAADEVDDPNDVDWEAAAEAVNQRAD